MNVPDYQELESAFGRPKELLGRLPECTESRRAREHLDLAKKYAYESREKVRPDRTGAVDGPAEAVYRTVACAGEAS